MGYTEMQFTNITWLYELWSSNDMGVQTSLMGFYPEYSDENLVGINMLSNMFIYIYNIYNYTSNHMGFVIPKEATIVEIEIFWIDEPYIYMLQLLKLPNQDNLLHHNTSFCLWHCSPT